MHEALMCSVPASRKGRGQGPCELRVMVTEENQIVLRALDRNGTPALVAVLDEASALQLMRGLKEAVDSSERPRVSVPRRYRSPVRRARAL